VSEAYHKNLRSSATMRFPKKDYVGLRAQGAKPTYLG